MSNLITAKHLSRHYGSTKALDDVSLTIERGKIVGLIGRNGAGKTTLLRSIMGLTRYDGELSVMGLTPIKQRQDMMKKMSFIADVATLPNWITIKQVIKIMETCHPHFKEDIALEFLKQTQIDINKKVKTFSKGMIVQAHLALIMAIESELMILDEPTLGLDIVYRKTFYSNLINDYFNDNRSIIISTHQVEEIEHILTDIIMIDNGSIILQCSMEEFNQRFFRVIVDTDQAEPFKALNPLSWSEQFGKVGIIFDTKHSGKIPQTEHIESASLSDVFVAKLEKQA
jgi:ABC-2 type transport system ATP-binding protein